MTWWVFIYVMRIGHVFVGRGHIIFISCFMLRFLGRDAYINGSVNGTKYFMPSNALNPQLIESNTSLLRCVLETPVSDSSKLE